MNPEKIIKEQAKSILRNNNWLTSICVVITYLIAQLAIIYTANAIETLINFVKEELINGFSGFSDIFDSILSSSDSSEVGIGLLIILAAALLTSPLLTGVIRYFYILAKHGKADYCELFYYFGKRFGSALRINLAITVRVFWRIFLCMLPSFTLFVLGNSLGYFDLYALCIVLNILGAGALLGGLLLSFRFCTGFFASVFLFIDNEELSVREILSGSHIIMKQFGRSANKLFCSFSGLILLCFLVIPIIFVLPYILLSMSVSAKWMITLTVPQPEPATAQQTAVEDAE